ncbi:MAG: hypothetical protein HRU33_14190 [Rhodobacteraceae bacterium]|nr:hypothetical protein [Paracoccaceae bacterium]
MARVGKWKFGAAIRAHSASMSLSRSATTVTIAALRKISFAATGVLSHRPASLSAQGGLE